LADKILPAGNIKFKYATEDNKVPQIQQNLSQLEQRKGVEVIDLTACRKLLKEKLKKENDRKSAIHSLTERIYFLILV